MFFGIEQLASYKLLGGGDYILQNYSEEEINEAATFIDPERNNIRGKEQEISAEGSKVKIFVIPTNEEIMIARDTQRITAALKK